MNNKTPKEEIFRTYKKIKNNHIHGDKEYDYEVYEIGTGQLHHLLNTYFTPNSKLHESNEKYLDEFKEYLKVKHNMPAYYVTDRYHPYEFELIEEFETFKKEVRENG